MDEEVEEKLRKEGRKEKKMKKEIFIFIFEEQRCQKRNVRDYLYEMRIFPRSTNSIALLDLQKYEHSI